MKKKCLLVIDQIRSGGAESILLDFYDYLETEGYDVLVYSLYTNKSINIIPSHLKVSYGLKANKNNIAIKILQQLVLYTKLMLFVNTSKPQILYSFLERSNILTILLPLKVKKIVTVHNVLSIQYQKIKSPLIKYILYSIIRLVYNRNRNIIAVSDLVKKDLIRTFRVNSSHITVCNNGVNEEKISNLSEKEVTDFIFEKNKHYIFNVGRLSKQKAQWKLIKAFSLLKKNVDMSSYHLIIMGEGEYETQLKELVTKLNLQTSVSFIPFKMNPYKYMVQADLFVLPSLFEGFPIVIAECLCLHIPFIGSTKAIPQEIFKDIKKWENVVYENNDFFSDFTLSISQDDILLSELMHKVLFEKKSKEIVENIELWKKSSLSKKNQFEQYLNIALQKK